MILEFDGFVGDAFVSEINRSVAPYLTEGKTNTAYNRDGYTVPVSQIDGLRDIDTKICSLFSEFQNNILKHRYRPQFPSADTGYEYHLYKPKDICHFHADGEVAGHFLRYATAILFLSDNDDGALVFPAQNVEINPQKGKLVVFPPNGVFSHYSKPAKEERIILMTWFVYNGITVQEYAT